MIERIDVLVGPSESGQTTQVTLRMERHDGTVYSNTRKIHVAELHADAIIPYTLSRIALEIAKVIDKHDGTGILIRRKSDGPTPTPSPS